jgi:DNA repair exonuclease SbcCD ATPase subunit
MGKMPKEKITFETDNTELLKAIRKMQGEGKSLREIVEPSLIEVLLKQKVNETIEDLPCKDCPKFGGIIDGKILCITKKTVDSPIKYHLYSTEIARACSHKPFNTPLDKKTREEFQRELKNMEQMKIYHKNRADELRPKAERLSIVEKQLLETMRELEEARKGKEELLNAKSTLESQVSEMKNSLIALMDEKAKLETQVTQLTQLNKELSKDVLVEKNSFLTVELGKRDQDIEHLKSEIEKQEALIEVLKQRTFQLTSEVEKMLREFEQFLPSDLGTCEQCVDSFPIKEYFKNTKKKIEAFKGYLQTITT